MLPINSYLKRIDILIADPDARIRSLVCDVLESCGFSNIMQTSNGEEALEKLQSKNVDLLITDWRMAPVNGIQLIDYLRTHKDSPSPYLPIIMLTGRAEHKDVSAARDIGVTEFLVKPFTAKALYERLIMVIENPRSFIISNEYLGPDRRRRTDIPPAGIERRKNPPIKGEI